MRLPAFAFPPIQTVPRWARSGLILCLICAGVGGIGLRADGASIAHDYLTQSWNTDHGLPHNAVHRLEQDRTGYLWLATAGGLVRFDGREFRTFTPPPELSHGDHEIRDLAVDRDGGLLILSGTGGVLRFRDGVFTAHPVTRELETGSIRELFAEADGTLWLGTNGPALLRWQNGRLESYGPAEGISRRGLGFYFAHDGQGVTWIAVADFLGCFRDGRLVRAASPGGRMMQIAPARDGGLWGIVDGRIMKRTPAGDWSAVPMPEPPWIKELSSVRYMHEDASGTLWCGTTSAGLFRLQDGVLTRESPVHPPISWLSEDREGNLWIATDGAGIRRMRPKAFVHFAQAPGVPVIVGTSVCEDGAGHIWFANRVHGLVRHREGGFDVFPCEDKGRRVFASCVAPAPGGDVWVGAPTGVYRFTPGTPQPFQRLPCEPGNVQVIFGARSGDLWVAGQTALLGRFRNGEWHTFGAAEGFEGETITTIAEDRDGNIWLGAKSGEVLCFAGDRFVPVAMPAALPRLRVHAIHPDADGDLWIGTLGGLVLRHGGSLHGFTRADGLPENDIGQILEDGAGRLWFGGARGLFTVPKAELLRVAAGSAGPVHAYTYGLEEGLPGISASTRFCPSACRDRNGMLWFSTYQGIVALDPTAVRLNPHAPPVLVDRLLVDGREVPATGGLRLPPGAGPLEFHFAALSFTAPEKVRLRHRLAGIDADWIDTDASRSARYHPLPPGRYEMRVSAANNDGVWAPEPASFTFVLVPAWWQTLWFRLLALVLAIAGLALLAQLWSRRLLLRRVERLEREHAVAHERARIARDLHDELGGGITALGFVIERLRAEPAANPVPAFRQLGERVRRLGLDLERVVWTVSPRNDSLDRFVSFVVRFAGGYFHETSVHCRVRVSDRIPARPIAPETRHHLVAILKESLHNVLKHAQARCVEIELDFDGGRLLLHVRDDGVGFDTAARSDDGNGLPNLRARVAELRGEFHLGSRPSVGTAIRVSVPL